MRATSGTITAWLMLTACLAHAEAVNPFRPKTGEEGCISGDDKTVKTGDLCEFSCHHGFCPESLCICYSRGPLVELPTESAGKFIAWDDLNADMNRLCEFTCKYGYCPSHTCTKPVVNVDGDGVMLAGNGSNSLDSLGYGGASRQNSENCRVFRNPLHSDSSRVQCAAYCSDNVVQAKHMGRTTNYGCVGFWPEEGSIPWTKIPGIPYEFAEGKCMCDHYRNNHNAETVIEALPIIAEIGCYIVTSSLRTLLDIGPKYIPKVGTVLDAGLDAAIVAAQITTYAYPKEEDPEGAFSWWLSPCTGTSLQPDKIKQVFKILSAVPDGVSSFKTPEKITKGSGKKGDDANPTDQSKPKPGTGKGPMGTSIGNAQAICSVPPISSTIRIGSASNTLRMQSCNGTTTEQKDAIITTITYGTVDLQISKTCSSAWSQACFHYSSAISRNAAWATLACPPAAGTYRHSHDRPVVRSWYTMHSGKGWTEPTNRPRSACDVDEYPPAYLLDENSAAYINAGKNAQGQLVRYIPDLENRGAASMWKGICFAPPIGLLADSEFILAVLQSPGISVSIETLPDGGPRYIISGGAVVPHWPAFRIDHWDQQGNPPPDDGLSMNMCWPSGIAAGDPGFALLPFDPWYNGKTRLYDYTKDYTKGSNGS